MRILVTGATGFVGSHLIESLSGRGFETVGLVRRPVGRGAPGHFIGSGPEGFSQEHLKGIDVVVHAAGTAHRSEKDAEKLRKLMIEGNAEWTKRICEAVAKSQVKALIHISSIAAADMPDANASRRNSAYGESKLLAEGFVSELAKTGRLAVNLRPPLIYGSGAKGNWPKLVKLARLPVPLPFGSVLNQRSFLGISNLCELVYLILNRNDQMELSGTYAVADNGFVSLSEIVGALRNKMGRKGGMFPFPVSCMDSLLSSLGKASMAEGLFHDLRIDASDAKRAFDWNPATETLPGMAGSLNVSKISWT